MKSLIIVLFALANSHNWIHGDSRCHHACTDKPAPARNGPRQPHRQVGAGQDFVIEWVTGHGGWYYFVVLKADQETKLTLHGKPLLEDYINSAPQSAYIYSQNKYERVHVSCNHLYPNDLQFGGCRKQTWNDGSNYERILDPSESRWIDRSGFDTVLTHEIAQFKYPQSKLSGDRRVSYFNSDYPWIEAVHKFQINAGGFGGEFDSARFTIPARSGSGEYMVHMIWGAYTDVVDVDVLPSRANDVYGRVSADKNWERIEHCQYPNTSNKLWSECRYYQPGDSIHETLDRCQRRFNEGDRCNAVNCVPLYTPSLVKIHGSAPEEANMPWFGPSVPNNNRNDCHLDEIPNWADENTFVCAGIQSAEPRDPAFNPETEEVFYIRDDDPEDPIFYSSCYRMSSSLVFDNNPDCPLCVGEPAEPVVPRWQIGDRCLTCESAQYDGKTDEVFNGQRGAIPKFRLKKWEFADKCERCF